MQSRRSICCKIISFVEEMEEHSIIFDVHIPSLYSYITIMIFGTFLLHSLSTTLLEPVYEQISIPIPIYLFYPKATVNLHQYHIQYIIRGNLTDIIMKKICTYVVQRGSRGLNILLYTWNPVEVEIGSNGALLEPYCPGQKFVMTNMDLPSNTPNLEKAVLKVGMGNSSF